MRFFKTFCILLISFQVVNRIMSDYFNYQSRESNSHLHLFEQLVYATLGRPHFEDFSEIGQSWFLAYVYGFRILILSLLTSMYINAYRTLRKDLEYLRLQRIIMLKKTIAYDNVIGGVTLSFFPLNVLILPLMPMIVFTQNPRISEFCLKIQYMFMISLYVVAAILLIFLQYPFLYIKLVTNATYGCFINQRNVSKLESMNLLIKSLFGGPLIILISLLVDLSKMPGQLFRESTSFERKYMFAAERINEVQITGIVKVF